MPNIINFFSDKKQNKIPISVITCYDYSFAKVVSQSEIDCILVGDSLGMVIQGNDSTIPVTLEEMIYHTKAVMKGSPNKFVICDMPFLSYQVSFDKAIENAGRIMKETNCAAIKLEGGDDFCIEVVERLVKIGIPVMGHVGLTPQSHLTLGGHKLQGREEKEAERIIKESKNLEAAGAFSIVFEMIPEKLAQTIQDSLLIPAIGIGAGRNLGGQVLVMQDLLGLNPDFNPKFLKKYSQLHSTVLSAFNLYNKEVKENLFPGEANIYL